MLLFAMDVETPSHRQIRL